MLEFVVYGDIICVFYCVCGGGMDLFFFGCGFCGCGDWLVVVFCDLCVGGDFESGVVGVVVEVWVF